VAVHNVQDRVPIVDARPGPHHLDLDLDLDLAVGGAQVTGRVNELALQSSVDVVGPLLGVVLDAC